MNARMIAVVRLMVVALAVVALLAGTVMADITIETVPVGNPGNADDVVTGFGFYGAVDYVYNIGKYEVTAAQYTEFLNAVQASTRTVSTTRTCGRATTPARSSVSTAAGRWATRTSTAWLMTGRTAR